MTTLEHYSPADLLCALAVGRNALAADLRRWLRMRRHLKAQGLHDRARAVQRRLRAHMSRQYAHETLLGLRPDKRALQAHAEHLRTCGADERRVHLVDRAARIAPTTSLGNRALAGPSQSAFGHLTA